MAPGPQNVIASSGKAVTRRNDAPSPYVIANPGCVRPWVLFLALISGLFSFDVGIATAQSGSYFNQRDDQYRLLGLKRAKEAFDAARAEHERQEQLFEKQLISAQTLEKSRRDFSDAEVNYQQSLLAVLFEQQYVVVSQAVKYQSTQGRKRVRVTLENASGGGEEFQKLIGIEDELFRSLQPDVVTNLYISLLNDEGAIISQPYERKVDRLQFGKPVTIDFGMLQDLDAVSVNLIYGSGTEQRRKIFLQKDASVNRAAIEAVQFSQEVELGSSTDYPLNLELFSGESNTFKLEVVNLPSEVSSYFLDPASGNRLNQFQFTEGINTRQAALRVFLPERPTVQVDMDQPMAFYALAVPRERVDEIGSLQERTLSTTEIEALNVGYARLELVPRGVGEIQVRVQQLFHTIQPGETVTFSFDLLNEGSRRLDQIRIETDLPLNWQDALNPEVVPVLNINGEETVTLQVTPPPEVSVGKYEVRLQTSALSDEQPIRGPDKVITISIEQPTNVWGTLLMVLLIVGLVAGMVVFGIRLSRR